MRWYVAYPLSICHIDELLAESGVHVDHSTITRWVVKYSPQLDAACHRQHRPGGSWRLDVTYICLQGTWVYLYRAVDKSGQTLDFLLTPGRDRKVAKRVLAKAIRRNGMLEKITIEKGGANPAAIISSSIVNLSHIGLIFSLGPGT